MGIKHISEVTRRDIFALFCDGYTTSSWIEGNVKVFYPYHGNLSEIDFLSKIYSLDKLPSTDTRFSTSEEDIWQHTVNNDDWEYGWVFTDSRFELQNGDDSVFLQFLCAVFHPAYRKENGYWKEYLAQIQPLLRADGYELYISDYISGRALYSWRTLTDLENINPTFLPFSQRYKQNNVQLPTISRIKRKGLVELMHRLEENEYLTDDTGWNFSCLTCEAVMDDIKKFYSPKAYNSENKYCDEENFDNFLMHTSPKNVFDAIEFFAKYKNDSFVNEVNLLINDLSYKLLDGKIMFVSQKIQAKVPTEHSLKDLIQIAENLIRKNDVENKQLALEKIWDAFEKMKTYYSVDKKSSLKAIIDKISDRDAVLNKKLNDEFAELTYIGNNYQIRHFETGKLPIKDVKLKEYLYARCLALINLSIGYIENK